MRKNKGFTLLESMVGLLVLSGVLLLLSGLLQHARKVEEIVSAHYQTEWHVFLLQLDNELSEVAYQHTTSQSIVTKTKENKTRTIKRNNQKIIKQESNGYQPLLMEVKQFVCEEKNNEVAFTVTFKNGEKRTGSWVFE